MLMRSYLRCDQPCSCVVASSPSALSGLALSMASHRDSERLDQQLYDGAELGDYERVVLAPPCSAEITMYLIMRHTHAHILLQSESIRLTNSYKQSGAQHLERAVRR